MDNSLVWVEAKLPYTANLWCRSSRWPAWNTYTEYTLKCTFSISLDIIDWSRIFRAMTRLSSMNIHARMLVFPHTESCLPATLRTSYGRDAVSALYTTLHKNTITLFCKTWLVNRLSPLRYPINSQLKEYTKLCREQHLLANNKWHSSASFQYRHSGGTEVGAQRHQCTVARQLPTRHNYYIFIT